MKPDRNVMEAEKGWLFLHWIKEKIFADRIFPNIEENLLGVLFQVSLLIVLIIFHPLIF
jgi:hypothetical protein